jgi:hypothetical protein
MREAAQQPSPTAAPIDLPSPPLRELLAEAAVVGAVCLALVLLIVTVRP